MIKTLEAVLVAGAVIAASFGCTGAGASKVDLESRSVDMRVAEHDVYYLEIVTTDVEAVTKFHADAYGWRFTPATPELGNARVATLPSGSMCGVRAPMSEQEKPIVRTYLRVKDVEVAARRAAQLGATIALEPTDISGRGRIAIYFLGGVEQGIWQTP
jgi:predicted enzyme related to lactoylglutathione lyase